MAKQRFFFDQDESCHWYMIPAEGREEWNVLSEDEDAWEKPAWSKFETCRLGGGISCVTFEKPIGNP